MPVDDVDITVTWTGSPGATSYQVWRAPVFIPTTYVQVATVNAGQQPNCSGALSPEPATPQNYAYQDPLLAAETQYYYEVIAVVGGVSSAPVLSTPASMFTAPTAPGGWQVPAATITPSSKCRSRSRRHH